MSRRHHSGIFVVRESLKQPFIFPVLVGFSALFSSERAFHAHNGVDEPLRWPIMVHLDIVMDQHWGGVPNSVGSLDPELACAGWGAQAEFALVKSAQDVSRCVAGEFSQAGKKSGRDGASRERLPGGEPADVEVRWIVRARMIRVRRQVGEPGHRRYGRARSEGPQGLAVALATARIAGASDVQVACQQREVAQLKYGSTSAWSHSQKPAFAGIWQRFLVISDVTAARPPYGPDVEALSRILGSSRQIRDEFSNNQEIAPSRIRAPVVAWPPVQTSLDFGGRPSVEPRSTSGINGWLARSPPPPRERRTP